MKFFIGTTNTDKIREIASILSSTGCTYEPTQPVNTEETEDDFEGNALLKARVYAVHAGGLTISEDSGLIIPALGGLPGSWSARFSDCEVDVAAGKVKAYTPSKTPREEMDRRNNLRVLELLTCIEQPRRAAAFKLVLAVAAPDSTILFKAVGESHGWIADQVTGSGGFGYDPIFVGHDTFGKTYAELDSMRKNRRSHRKAVLDEFQTWLGQYLKKWPRQCPMNLVVDSNDGTGKSTVTV